MVIEAEPQLKIQDASRAFPFAFRTPQSILENFERYYHNPQGKISILEVYLAHKTKESKYSAGMLSPIGGKMVLGETPLQTAYRRVHEESTLVCSPLKEKEDHGFSINGSFNYSIVSNPDGKRRVYFSVIPVINPDIITSIYPVQDDSKIDGFYGLSLDELSHAFNTGFHIDGLSGDTFPIQGHITRKKDALDTDMTKGNRHTQRTMLNQVERVLRRQELNARRRLYDSLVYHAITKKKLNPEAFPVPLTDFLAVLDEKQQQGLIKKKSDKLEELMIYLKRTLGDEFEQFFVEAYSAVLGRLYMRHFRSQEEKYWDGEGAFKKKKTIKSLLESLIPKKKEKVVKTLFFEAEMIKRRMTEGNFSTDVLHFLPLFINMEQSYKGRTTRLIVELVRFMRDLTRQVTSIGTLTTLDEINSFYLDWKIPLERKQEHLKKFDERLIDILIELFNTDRESITGAWHLAGRFIPELAEEARISDPKLSQLYQFHELRNEIANASLGQALLLALGVDVKGNGPDWPIVKFEALRQLTFFLKILFEKPNYDKIIRKKPHPVDLGINSFFGPVVNKRVITLNSNGYKRKMPITYRRGINNYEFIVDEKPVKSLRSAIRKGLEESISNIADIQSCAIVLPNDIYGHLSFDERINFTNKQADAFISFLRENYPSWQLDIMEDKNTFDNYRAAINDQKVSDGGKRTGSKGELLIRRKIKIKMIDKKSKEFYNYELVFYPFEEFDGVNYHDAEEKKLTGLMGWKEKIEDDPSYSVRRLIYPLRGVLGLKSIYELLFPPSLYPELISEVRESRVTVYKHVST